MDVGCVDQSWGILSLNRILHVADCWVSLQWNVSPLCRFCMVCLRTFSYDQSVQSHNFGIIYCRLFSVIQRPISRSHLQYEWISCSCFCKRTRLFIWFGPARKDFSPWSGNRCGHTIIAKYNAVQWQVLYEMNSSKLCKQLKVLLSIFAIWTGLFSFFSTLTDWPVNERC